jgi:ParB family transcriptional regulator, chromosome partitioning protein
MTAGLVHIIEDMAGAAERLLTAAGTRRFEHTVAQLREERASAEAQAQAAQSFSERGLTVLWHRPQAWDEACIPLNHLGTADGQQADEQAVTDPAHWAVLLYEDTGLRDAQTGELVEQDAVDWDTEDQPDATPAEGLRHAATVTEATVFVPEYFCLDYRGAGLTPQARFARNAGMVDTGTGHIADLDAEASEAARQHASTPARRSRTRRGRKARTPQSPCTQQARRRRDGCAPGVREKALSLDAPMNWFGFWVSE